MGVEGILIVMIYRRAKKIGGRKPEYKLKSCPPIEYALMLIFLMGIAYTILNFFKII